MILIFGERVKVVVDFDNKSIQMTKDGETVHKFSFEEEYTLTEFSVYLKNAEKSAKELERL